jgi:sodium/bile acid cotransporter 7
VSGVRFDPFTAGIPVALGLALAAPRMGVPSGPLHTGYITTVGIAVMFFLHGAATSLGSLKAATAHWRLHVFVHTSTYVVFPIIGLGVFWITRTLLPDALRLGVFYLCAVSSTVSSSVALTAVARGNVSAAMFEATLSGLIGIVLTPLLVGFVTVTTTRRAPIPLEIMEILLQLLVPFVLGLVLRPRLRGLLAKRRGLVRAIDQAVILLIIYSAFCGAVMSGFWASNALSLLAILGLVLILLGAVLALTTLASQAVGFSREDEIAAVFCSSKKSLVNGAPIAKVIFGNSPALGMIMLPLLLYHPLQLMVCSVLARRYEARAE